MTPVYGQDNFSAARESLVKQQISDMGIKDKATLADMREVPHHLFVPDAQINREQDMKVGM